jgi:hypothetical protein
MEFDLIRYGGSTSKDFRRRVTMEEVRIFSCVIDRYQDYKNNSNSQRIDLGNKFNQ